MNPRQEKLNTGHVASITATHLLHDVYTSFFAPLLPLLSEKLGFAYAMAGTLSVLQRLPALLNPLIGLLADRIVVRSGIILCPAVSILAMSMIGLAPSVALIAVLMFVSGISSAVYHVTAPVLMRRVSGDKVGRGMSFFMFGGELARTLGPLLITAAVSWWGIEGSWKLIPVGLVASLLLFLNLRTIDKKQIRSYNRPKRESFGNSFKGLAPLFHTILPILFFRGFSKTALSLFLPSYMTESGHSLKTAAAALALMELSGALGALAAGTVSDKIGRKTVLLAIMLVSPLFMFLFTLSTGIVSWLLLVIIGLVFFASTPVFMAMVHDIDSDRPSMANGIFMTLNFVSGSAIALLLGLVADHYSLLTAFKMSALLGLPAILPVIWMKEKKRPE